VAIVHDIPEVGEGDIPVMILEYLQGTDLAELRQLRRQLRRQLPVAEVLDWIDQAGAGVQHAHEQGILHRDLKPANLMRLEDGGRIKVLDFGLAAVADAGGLTRSGMLMGSLPYMPPEQLRGERVDERADVYALAATTFELLAGRVPFEENDSHRERCPQLEGTRPDLPAGVDAIMRRGLAPRAEDRPSSMAEFRELFAELAARASS
jgi:serine/threonine protein kinase